MQPYYTIVWYISIWCMSLYVYYGIYTHIMPELILILHELVACHILPCYAIPGSVMCCFDMLCCVMLWYDVFCCGMPCGVAWCDLMWCDVV